MSHFPQPPVPSSVHLKGPKRSSHGVGWLLMIGFLSFSALRSQAATHEQLGLQGLPCSEKALTLLQEWGAQDQWLQKFSEDPGEKRFHAPTATLGKWVQVKKTANKDLIFSQFSENSSLNVKFDSQCKTVADVQTFKKSPLTEKKIGGISLLQDSRIEGLLQSQKAMVFFLWSPHMQISVEALREVKAACQKGGVSLYAVVEPGANPSSIKYIAQKLAIPLKHVFYLNSFDLTLRGFRLHFPSLIVAHKGRFTSPVRRGHEDSATYEDYIRTHL